MHPEWAMLIDLPTITPSIEKIFGSRNYTCPEAGGDYSLPKAQTQALHKDVGDFYGDPHKVVTVDDGPPFFIVVNFLMVDFTREVGAIRFIPCTQRSRHAPPGVQDEPTWMRESIVCAPAGTAVIRDVRCWHGGTANVSQTIRPMTSVGYFAPWYRYVGQRTIPRALYNTLSPHAQKIAADVALG
jgi:ectoine hydroxylase-related dioxygenase (phytanoyl-CoA dioxygenase family)